MKPNFALSLSLDGIALMHRAFPGWHLVGKVAFEVDNLTDQLATLRRTATGLDKAGLRCKLILPNDQIRYASVTTISTDPEEVTETVRRVLEESTPYRIDELAYDVARDGDRLMIAAVARLTLAEAENFAAEYRFNPVCFVAMPNADDFAGEPFFGTTSRVDQYLEPGETLQRDATPVRVIGTVPRDLPAQETDQGSAGKGDDLAAALAAAGDTDAPSAARKDKSPLDAAAEALSPSFAVPDEKARALRWFSQKETAHYPSASDAPSQDSDDGTSAAAMFSSIRADRSAPTGGEPLAIRARRDHQPALHAQDPESENLFGAEYDTDDWDEPEDTDDMDAPPEVPMTRTDDTDWRAETAAQAPEDEPDTTSTPPVRRDASFFARAKPGLTASPPAAVPSRGISSERERMTVFGERSTNTRPTANALGIILTIAMLLVLAGAAVWATLANREQLANFFRPQPMSEVLAGAAIAPGTTESFALVESPQEDALADEADIRLAALESGPETDAPEPPLSLPIPRSEAAPLWDQDATAPTPTARPESTTAPEPDAAPGMSKADRAQASYAVTGIWATAPEQPDVAAPINLDDLYIASIDPPVAGFDAVALPVALAPQSDERPQTPTVPAPADTTYDFDARGLVVATDKGAVTPDGVTVFTGRPKRVPPTVPERLAQAPESTLTQEQDNLLAARRPKPRPENLIEQNERSAFGGRSLSELAALRPKLRPKRADPIIPKEVPDMSAAVAAAVAGVVPQPAETGGTRFATAVSRKPAVRPKDLTQRGTNNSEAGDDDEPEISAASAAKIRARQPTSQSVANQATLKNAINLRKLNLIGVYGKPANRRALVRLSNGRYQKVKVGDKIDGGRVSAIGESELRYTKGGRNLVLNMPKS